MLRMMWTTCAQSALSYIDGRPGRPVCAKKNLAAFEARATSFSTSRRLARATDGYVCKQAISLRIKPR
ncbi:MAG: hypothetical protein QOJ65_1182 [Fimbriimonadaceae bacterium]|jgi:hypothetical protein|nr:hypothetical protein [Fimbriimonadaceae bacterium]